MDFLQILKEHIALKYPLSEPRGCFLSTFDRNDSLINSHGVLSTDKELGTVIDMMYHGLIEKNKNRITSIICDIVLSTELLESVDSIKSTNLANSGLSITTLDYSKSWVILPGTQGITSITQTLQLIKKKNGIRGNVIIYAFTTEKIAIDFSS